MSQTSRTVTGSRSQLGFSEGKKRWWRYLTVDGERLFNIGNICHTCQYQFERLPGNTQANIEIGQRLSEKLNAGMSDLTLDTLSEIEMIMPDGDYAVLFMKIKPTLCQPGDVNDYFANEHIDEWELLVDDPIQDPEIPYYRLRTALFGEEDFKTLFVECAVPLSPPNSLDSERVEHYRQVLKDGSVPTVLALGLCDSKMAGQHCKPKPDESIYGHNLLHYYLMDGHHKIQAAAELGQEIGFLVYLNIENDIGHRLNRKELEFLQVAHLQPLPKHEEMLEILNDRSKPAPTRFRALQRVIPYIEFRRIFNALIRIASNDEEPVEMVEAAAKALGTRWRCHVYIPKHEMDLLAGLTSTAREIVGTVETAWEW